MYYYISGEYVHTDFGFVVVDCAGVGYKIYVSSTTSGRIGKLHDKVKLYTYLQVREDAMDLYGFHSLAEQSAFLMLISISGVGAKVAMNVLSTFSAEDFAVIVASSDHKALTRAPGIGSKTAQRIVLELKDKISMDTSDAASLSKPIGGSSAANSNLSDAITSLAVLGYSKSEAAAALKDVDPTETVESMVKYALKALLRN